MCGTMLVAPQCTVVARVCAPPHVGIGETAVIVSCEIVEMAKLKRGR